MQVQSKEVIEIEGMGCEHCVRAVRESLDKVDDIDVDSVEIGRAVIRTDDLEKVRPAIVHAVQEAGYAVK